MLFSTVGLTKCHLCMERNKKRKQKISTALGINLKALLQVFDFETRIFWLSCHDVFVLKTMLKIDFQFVHAFAIYYKAESHRKVYSVSLRSNFYFMAEKVPVVYDRNQIFVSIKE